MRHPARFCSVAVLFSALLASSLPAHAQAANSRPFEEAAADMLSKLGSGGSAKSTDYESVFEDEDNKAGEDTKSTERGKADGEKSTKNLESVVDPANSADNVPLGRSLANAPDTNAAPPAPAAKTATPAGPGQTASGQASAGQTRTGQGNGSGTSASHTASSTAASTASSGFAPPPKANASPGFVALQGPGQRSDAAPKTR